MILCSFLSALLLGLQDESGHAVPRHVRAKLLCIRPVTRETLYLGSGGVWSENGVLLASPTLSWPYRIRWNKRGDQAIIDDLSGTFLATDTERKLTFRKLSAGTVAAWEGDALIMWKGTSKGMTASAGEGSKTRSEWSSVWPLACSADGKLILGRKAGTGRLPGGPHVVVSGGTGNGGLRQIPYYNDSDDLPPRFIELVGDDFLVGTCTSDGSAMQVMAFDRANRTGLQGKTIWKWLRTMPSAFSSLKGMDVEKSAYVPNVPIVAGSMLLLPIGNLRDGGVSFLLIFSGGKHVRSVELGGAYLSSYLDDRVLWILCKSKDGSLKLVEIDTKKWRISGL